MFSFVMFFLCIFGLLGHSDSGFGTKTNGYTGPAGTVSAHIHTNVSSVTSLKTEFLGTIK